MTDNSNAQWMLWTGRVMSWLVVAVMFADAAVNIMMPHVLAVEQARVGFEPASSAPLGILMLFCAITYLTPRFSVIGAILITGFFGGAICAHFRIGEVGGPSQILAALIAALAWLGLYLKSGAVRTALLYGTTS